MNDTTVTVLILIILEYIYMAHHVVVKKTSSNVLILIILEYIYIYRAR